MKKLLVATAVSACLVSSIASAEVRVNGFANLTAGYAQDENVVFGFSDDVDFSQQSLFAVQISGDINEKMSATGQILARGANDFEAKFEWAYLTYQVSDSLNVSAGRIRLPLFLYSESLDVGYSYHWIDAPQTVYGIDFNNMDGIRLDYSTYSGDWEFGSQVAFGVINNPELAVGGGATASLRGNNTLLVSMNVGYESFKGRVVFGASSATLDVAALDPLVAAVSQFSTSLADDILYEDDPGRFYGASLSYDNFNWFATAEYTLNTNDGSFIQDDEAFYITAGTRLGKYTPSITYQRRDGNDGFKFTEALAALPAPIQAAIGPSVVGVELSQFEDYSMVTLGVRYDLSTQTALKAELIDFNDRLTDSSDTNIFRFAVNYVF